MVVDWKKVAELDEWWISEGKKDAKERKEMRDEL
jgi:hypothetical protein